MPRASFDRVHRKLRHVHRSPTTQKFRSTFVYRRLVTQWFQTVEFYKHRARVWQHFHSEHECVHSEDFRSEVVFFRSEFERHWFYRELGMSEAAWAGRSEHCLTSAQLTAVS